MVFLHHGNAALKRSLARLKFLDLVFSELILLFVLQGFLNALELRLETYDGTCYRVLVDSCYDISLPDLITVFDQCLNDLDL